MISVVMPVFNCGSYLAEAIESILNQNFSDFEFIIVNDGSTDNSLEIINSYRDKRITTIHLNTKRGQYPARNIGLSVAIGKYICVMDGDDVSLPDRLDIQFHFMEANPGIGIAGSQVKFIGNRDKISLRPEIYEELKVQLLMNNCFVHPSLMIRNQFRKKYKLNYKTNYNFAADYDFLVRSMQYFPVVNLPDILLNYRWHDKQITSCHFKEQQMIADKIKIFQLRNFGINATSGEKILHLMLMNIIPVRNKETFSALLKWANYLVGKNLKTGYYHTEYLIQLLRNLLKSIQRISLDLNELIKNKPID